MVRGGAERALERVQPNAMILEQKSVACNLNFGIFL